MAKRTDLAAPSVIDPAAFTFVAGCYFGGEPGEDMDEILGEWMAERDEDGSKGWYSKRAKVREHFPALVAEGNFARKGTCDHCGAHFDWGAVFKHTSGGHIVVGNICVSNTLEVPNRAQLDKRRMQSRLAAAREAARMAAKARAEAATLGFEWLYSETHADRTLADIARKGLAWGGITARQLDLVKRIRFGVKPQWQLDKEARDASRAAEKANSVHVGTVGKRIDLRLTIVRHTERENTFRWPVTINHWYLLKQGDNVFTYSGSVNLGAEGETVEAKWSVKEHSEYQGTKQTKLARPTFPKEPTPAADDVKRAAPYGAGRDLSLTGEC